MHGCNLLFTCGSVQLKNIKLKANFKRSLSYIVLSKPEEGLCIINMAFLNVISAFIALKQGYIGKTKLFHEVYPFNVLFRSAF